MTIRRLVCLPDPVSSFLSSKSYQTPAFCGFVGALAYSVGHGLYFCDFFFLLAMELLALPT